MQNHLLRAVNYRRCILFCSFCYICSWRNHAYCDEHVFHVTAGSKPRTSIWVLGISISDLVVHIHLWFLILWSWMVSLLKNILYLSRLANNSSIHRLAALILQDPGQLMQMGVGYSGILFCYAVVESYHTTETVRSVFGMFNVPARVFPFILLIILQVGTFLYSQWNVASVIRFV